MGVDGPAPQPFGAIANEFNDRSRSGLGFLAHREGLTRLGEDQGASVSRARAGADQHGRGKLHHLEACDRAAILGSPSLKQRGAGRRRKPFRRNCLNNLPRRGFELTGREPGGNALAAVVHCVVGARRDSQKRERTGRCWRDCPWCYRAGPVPCSPMLPRDMSTAI